MRRVASRRVLRVASHNIMDGLYLPELLAQYRAQQRGTQPFHALCVQEVVPHSAAAIAANLGRRFVVAAHWSTPRLALVYDRALLRLRGLRAVALPLLERLPAWQRIYARIEQRHALVGDFRCRRGRRRLALANFHLDTGGENAHRAAQISAIATAVPARRAQHVVACGDTNCFTWNAAHAEHELGEVLAPLARRHGTADAHIVALPPPRRLPTHFFARVRARPNGARDCHCRGYE
jgi:endonuclease/exonuclease/phosphatase family metal-dependent hydrolase